MLTPLYNPTMTGRVCVTEGQVWLEGELPREATSPPVTVCYQIDPPETALAPFAEPVEIEVWDPASPINGRWYKKSGNGRR